jgi:hypothetical protein
LTEEETKKKIDAAIAQYYADYLQWQSDYDSLLQSLLNPSMSRRAKKRWDKAERRWKQSQRKKAKGKRK